jgi:hypothetical protein
MLHSTVPMWNAKTPAGSDSAYSRWKQNGAVPREAGAVEKAVQLVGGVGTDCFVVH